jgi:hypothetical protein
MLVLSCAPDEVHDLAVERDGQTKIVVRLGILSPCSMLLM